MDSGTGGREADSGELSRLGFDLLDQISHDLRSPLGSILMWARVLRQAPAGGADALSAIDMIEKSASSMAARLDELDDMRAAIAAESSRERERVDLATLASAATDALREGAAARGVSIGAPALASTASVMASPRRLRQALDLALASLLRTAPRDAILEVRVLEAESEACCTFALSVPDQAHADGAPSGSRRAGLPMRLAQRLIELEGGSLRSEDRPSRIVTIRIPRTDGAMPAPPSEAP